MARRDKYHINYEKLYPGIEIPPEVLSVLRKGDRKEEYQEVDLKQERFVYDPETKTAYFIPGREDSYERLIEDEKRQFSNEDPTPEEHLMPLFLIQSCPPAWEAQSRPAPSSF